MGVANFVQSSFASCIDILSGESVAIGAETKKGVIEDIGAELMLGEGGDNNQRGLRISFPAGVFSTLPKSGKRATCRGITWQITRVDNGPGSLVIEMAEPERKG